MLAARRRPASAAGGADQREHPQDRDRAEDQTPDPPREGSVAEQLDRAGHDQLGQLGMLGVGIGAQRRRGVVRAAGRPDPGDYPSRIDVVGLVEDQGVLGLPWCTATGTAVPSQAARAAKESTETTAKSSSGVDGDVRRRLTMAEATVHIHCRRVDFEKWHALGNDYLILEAAALPFALTAGPCTGALRRAYGGLRRRRAAAQSRPTSPASWLACGSSTPMAPKPSCLATAPAKRCSTCAGRGWTDSDHFRIQTAAGEIQPTITSPTTASLSIGRVRLRSPDYPAGAPDGIGELVDGERTWTFQHVQVGNPQCAIRMPDEAALAALELAAIGPGIEHHELFPNRTNVSWYVPLAPDRIRARIFERGVGETSASGTGATGAAVAHVLAGGDSPVTVVLDGGELEVEVGEDLHVTLSGWAVPVFRGTLAEEFVKELHEAE